MYVGLPGFHEAYFGGVVGLDTASQAIFQKCEEGSCPLFRKGWTGWPNDANQDGVLSWFADISQNLAAFAESFRPTLDHRRPLAQPNKPIRGSTAERKLDIGFVNDPQARSDSRCRWSQILVPGELKSNPSADIASKAWLDLGRYAREVLTAQDTRRFVLGFTICGSLMRIWMFDRLGGIASEQFDINHDGLQFVSTVLGFLWMDEEELGFDPSITAEDGKRVIKITRNGKAERLVIDKLMKRAPCIAGRATTCCKAHREEDPQTKFVVKDSWQYPERDEEGELLKEAASKGVVNVARHYHHENVIVRGEVDDIRGNVRRGLNVTEARNYRPERSVISWSTSTTGPPRTGRSSTVSVKRSSSQTGAPVPPGKRSCSASPTKAGNDVIPNRIHRRVILRDYGTAIYKASSRSVLLAALEGCVEGHESLHKAGLLHRDISISNLMVNEDNTNSSWPFFLIDLDLAIKEHRDGASGARGKTGTRAFMAIGALLGEQHSFMHDLESFFWVLFWICIHYNGPDESRVVPRFDKWNYVDPEELAGMKLGVVAKEAIFLKTITDNVTQYYEPLVPLLNGLRTTVFPGDKPWEQEDERLYSQIRQRFREQRHDLE
ncbi:serine threonine-protein kinase sgk2 [Verticillium dahliae]